MNDLTHHQNAAIGWLKRAHDANSDDGVGYGYYLRGLPFRAYGFGWRPSYVETSGYIVETFYDIGTAYNDSDASLRAERVGHWLVKTQNEDGSFSNASMENSDGIVFDTGQVLFGLVRCYAETGKPVFEAAARKAAYWLAERVDEDGAWRTNTHLGRVHTYNARVAWAMLEYCKVIPDETVKAAARQNLMWVVSQQTETGFLENCSFKEGNAPFTHTIAYAIRGLFEGGRLLGDELMLEASLRAAIRATDHIDESGFIPGRISVTGVPDNSYSCLTGNCQLAIVWLKMSEFFKKPELEEAADLTLDYVLGVHNIKTRNKNICGAVKGSHPIWGGYTPLAYPNWATKFLIEAILTKQSLLKA